jgi:hypothetical protein
VLLTHRTVGGRCPCGAEHAACGPPSDTVPVDARIEEVAAVGGPLRKYNVRMPSGTQTVMKFNDEEANARGLSADDLADASAPHVEVQAEGADTEGQADAKMAPPAQNKARAASANKGRGARGGS